MIMFVFSVFSLINPFHGLPLLVQTGRVVQTSPGWDISYSKQPQPRNHSVACFEWGRFRRNWNVYHDPMFWNHGDTLILHHLMYDHNLTTNQLNCKINMIFCQPWASRQISAWLKPPQISNQAFRRNFNGVPWNTLRVSASELGIGSSRLLEARYHQQYIVSLINI